MVIPPPILHETTSKNTMLLRVSIEYLEECKRNACEILKSNTQFATAKIVEELIDQEIENRKIIEKFNSLYEQFHE